MPRKALTGTEHKTKKAYLKGGRDVAKGKHAPTLSLQQLQEDFNRARMGAKEQFEPIKQNALSEFQQYTQPGVAAQYGGGGEQKSSSLNQALAAARSNLSRQLASDFAGFENQQAQYLLGTREQNKTNYMNTLAGLSQSQLANAPQYLPSGQGPSKGKAAFGGAISGALQGAAVGGPWGALAGAAIGGVGGYAGAGSNTNYGPAAQASGGWLQNKFGSTPPPTTTVGGA